MRRLITLGVVVALSLLAASCSSSKGTGPSSNGGPSGVLTIDNESGGTWTCDFNPFNPSDYGFVLGNVYEPLVFVNALQSGKTTPWLASHFAWGNGNTKLTFTIRSGVKFSNGTPMTAADVVYTFSLLKQNKTLDINGVWSVLSSVTQQGANKVVMTFKTKAVPDFYYIADQVPIVPKAVWSKIANPVTYLNKNPIGTGAFEVSSKTCTPQNIKYTANPNYWQPGLPKVGTVNYPAFLTNDTANVYLANGQAQWGSQYIPSITKFLSGQPTIKWWFPPVDNVTLYFNLTNPILKNLAVRQAMAYAIDRSKAASLGEGGEEPPGNQTGVVTPTFSSWLDTSQAAAYGNNYAYNPKKAISILEKAGFKRGSNGIFRTPSGQPLSFTLLDNAGFSDWLAAVSVIQQNLKAVGIQVTTQNVAYTTWQTDLYSGKFQLGYGADNATGPSPWFEFRQLLDSAYYAPIGTSAGGDWERYVNKSADALINSYGSAATTAAQHQIVNKLELIMLKDVPVIPITGAVDWFQYDTGKFTGWPTAANPYAQPAAYNAPDWGQVMLHLVPKK